MYQQTLCNNFPIDDYHGRAIIVSVISSELGSYVKEKEELTNDHRHTLADLHRDRYLHS